MLPCPRGEGPGWREGEEAYLWDSRTGQILWQDGTPTRNEAVVAAEEERIKDKDATGVSADICSGTQSMGPVYRHRKKHAYLPLDNEEEVFSAAQQMTVKNIRYDIMKTSPEETMIVIVRETQKLKKRTKVKRIKLDEVWLSMPCNTYCKMGYINREHQFRVKEDPLRKPNQGTKNGKQAEEVDALAKKALLIIECLARKKAEQLETGVMMVVDEVEVDLREMEWFLENPVSMLVMQDFMEQFEKEFKYEMKRLMIDYCAWGHYC